MKVFSKIKQFIRKVKKKITKKQIIITIIVLLILIIMSIFNKYLSEKKYREEILDATYNEYTDFKSPKEYIIYSGSTYLKEEDSKEENIEKDIYLKFKNKLESNETGNQDFYETTIKIIANTLRFINFRLIDENQKLVITVYCSDTAVRKIYYNGEDNYFEKKGSIESLSNYTKTEITEMEIKSTEIQKLIQNDWDFSKKIFGDVKDTKDGYEIYGNGEIKIKTISKKVFNIIFEENYNQYVIGNVKVGTERSDIKKLLGNPAFENYNYIGYKGKDIYVFFGKNFISAYRVDEDKDNYEEFLQIQKNFREDKNIKKLISDTTQLWDDYDIYNVKSNYVNIQYTLRGIKIQFNVGKENGFAFYNNFIGKITDKLDITLYKTVEEELPIFTYVNAEEDLVNEYEYERSVIYE